MAGTGGQAGTPDAGSDYHYYSGIWGSGPNDVYVTAYDGTIKHSADRGTTWTTAAQLAGKPALDGVWGTGADDVYVFGMGGQAFRSTDGGQTWSALVTGTNNDLEAMWGTGPLDLYLAGTNSTLLHSSDHGATWTAMTLPAIDGGAMNDELSSIWGTSAGEVFVLGTPIAAADPSVVLHWNGGAWLPTTVFSNFHEQPFLWSVAGSSTTDMYLGPADNGALLRSTDDGASWSYTSQIQGLCDSPRYLWLAGPGNIWVASNCSVAHSTDGAASWTVVFSNPNPAPHGTSLTGIWGSAAGDVYAVGLGVILKVQ
jgi:photosystem II stability/assembly factor-like uncharacterized protein